MVKKGKIGEEMFKQCTEQSILAQSQHVYVEDAESKKKFLKIVLILDIQVFVHNFGHAAYTVCVTCYLVNKHASNQWSYLD